MAKYKVPNFGPGGRPETLNLTRTGTANNVGSPLPHPGDLGVCYEESTKRWQIVEAVDAQNGAAGDVLYWKSYASYTATPTIGNSSQNEVAGIAELQFSTPSTTQRVMIAVRQGGVIPVKSADATINARGLGVTSDTSANRVILQAGVVKPIGISQAAQATGFVSTFLTIFPA